MTTLIRASNPKARKSHRCIPCRIVIEPGMVYRRETWSGNDKPRYWISCVACEDITGTVADWAGGDEIWAEEFAEWADENRDDARALAFLARRYPTMRESK